MNLQETIYQILQFLKIDFSKILYIISISCLSHFNKYLHYDTIIKRVISFYFIYKSKNSHYHIKIYYKL